MSINPCGYFFVDTFRDADTIAKCAEMMVYVFMRDLGKAYIVYPGGLTVELHDTQRIRLERHAKQRDGER